MKRLIVLSLLCSALLPAGSHADEIGRTTVFARVGAPGMPEGILVRDGIVYVGTHASVRGNANSGASKIFRYDLGSGALLGERVIEGQNLAATHGILAIVSDADGNLYVLDRNPPRLLRIDAVTGTQTTYATFPELPACRPVVGPETGCAPVTVDEPAYPDYVAFAPDGTAYVTDLQAATIYRVPPGGTGSEHASVWYQDARLDSIFGPNGIVLSPEGTHLIFAMTGAIQPTTPGQGIIYRLPIVDEPSPDDLETLFVYPEPAAGPDGIALGASGRLYVALAGGNQVSALEQLNGTWTEVLRIPANPVENAQQEIPYDLPASIAFDPLTRSLLVTNQSYFAADPQHWAVLRVFVDDVALPLFEPDLG